MKKHVFCLSAAVILLGVFNAFAQKEQPQKQIPKGETVWDYRYYKPSPSAKISIETESLPPDFSSHDVVKLFDNISRKIANKKSASAKAKSLTGAKVLDGLAVEDLFAFTVNWDKRKYARNANDRDVEYEGYFYGLEDNSSVDPHASADGGCGMGSGGGTNKTVESREDLIKRSDPGDSLDAFWQNNHFTLERFNPIYDRKFYKGKLIKNETLPDCSFTYVVPSPQKFYQMAFVGKQPYQLVDVESSIFNLKNYNYEKVNNPGVVAWESDLKKESVSGERLRVIFVVKLVPPFVRTRTIEQYNQAEKTNFTAIVNQIVVDIVGIWIIDAKTGKVLSKEIGQKSDR